MVQVIYSLLSFLEVSKVFFSFKGFRHAVDPMQPKITMNIDQHKIILETVKLDFARGFFFVLFL